MKLSAAERTIPLFGEDFVRGPAAKARQRKRYQGAFGDVSLTQDGDLVCVHRELEGGSTAGVVLTRFEAMELAMRLARILEDKDE